MSRHFALYQGTVNKKYKIEVTYKILGITIWKQFLCRQVSPEGSCHDITYDTVDEALGDIETLENTNKYKEILDES